MSKAVDRPVWPLASRNLKRWFVSSGVPKPANIRIVHGLPRYIVACGPRVSGYCPGSPSLSSYVHPRDVRSLGRYVALSGKPLIVLYSSGVSGFFTGGAMVSSTTDTRRED